MTRPKHAYRRKRLLDSRWRENRAALLRVRTAESCLRAETLARKEAERVQHMKARAAYLDIIAAYAARDPYEESERWGYDNPELIEHRRDSGLPPIGWCQTYNVPIYYPDWMVYETVYPRVKPGEAAKIMKRHKKIRNTP